ncbi:hypothetical protein BDP27DRAFT_30762 [Rhodocollybia butyracea]|uniref:Uncharacterized protein n=1 Tax=Rhodocollybia butyracea TaxID=206335 RepID=A0A9P5Q643_9AGAR|nr:hypothetical protein BDP27DRAFT_30762 [Rhodocollybia butyracea]
MQNHFILRLILGAIQIFLSVSPTSSLMGDISSITFSTPSNPHFQASSFAVDLKQGIRSPQEYRTFIATYYNLPHHPMVWNQILLNAIKHGSFTRFTRGDDAEAVFCSAVVKAIWPSPPSSDDWDYNSLTMTMAEAIHIYWRKEYKGLLRNFFHTMLSPFESSSIRGGDNQILVLAMEFAFYHITRNPSNLESSHWEIIDHIFTHHDSTASNAVFNFQANVFHAYLAEFVVRLVKTSEILCDTSLKSESDVIFRRRATILNVYEKTRTISLSARRARILSDETEFSLLRRTIQGTLQGVHCLVDHQDIFISEAVSLSFMHALDVLSLALGNGSPEAFQIAVDHRYLELLHKFGAKQRKIDDHSIRVLNCYLVGLRKLTATAREAGISYLYEPRNLRLVITLLIFRRFHAYSVLDRDTDTAGLIATGSKTITVWLTQLTSLRPDTTVWTDCLSWLSRVQEWALDVDNLENSYRGVEDIHKLQVQNFIDQSLGEGWLGTVLQLPLIMSEEGFRSSPFIRELQMIIQWLDDFIV